MARLVVTSRATPATPNAVARWHALLCAIAVLNLGLWSLAALAVTRTPAAIQSAAGMSAHLQLLLSAGYVLGCAFRSVLPVYDIPRMVVVDSRLSSVAVGRTVATIAELCFAAQWALMLHDTAVLTHNDFAATVSIAIVPLIVIAEICSWHAVLTTAQRGHVVENSLWGLSATLVIAGLLMIGPQRLPALYPSMIAWCIGGAAFIGFIFLFDVPMYWSRWLADEASGRRYLTMSEGAIDVSRRWVVSRSWQDWKDEVAWMTLYFSFGVWSSISIVYASLALK